MHRRCTGWKQKWNNTTNKQQQQKDKRRIHLDLKSTDEFFSIFPPLLAWMKIQKMKICWDHCFTLFLKTSKTPRGHGSVWGGRGLLCLDWYTSMTEIWDGDKQKHWWDLYLVIRLPWIHPEPERKILPSVNLSVFAAKDTRSCARAFTLADEPDKSRAMFVQEHPFKH